MKKIIFTMLFLGMFLVVADGVMAQNCNPNDNQIAVFEHANYNGRCSVRNVGNYASSEALGMPNDSISSIIIGRNVYAILCRDNNFRGTCQTFQTTDPTLVNNTVGNDQVSSIKVIRKAGGPIRSTGNRETGFRVMINGIHCLQTGDGGNGTDEPYIEVFVDGKFFAKWGPRPMNEADRSWWEKITDDLDSLTRKAQQEFWLMPGSVYAQNTVTFKFWEEDSGRNSIIDKDDFIGEITFNRSSPNGNNITREFREGNGRWKVVFTKATRTNIDSSVEGASPRIPVRVPILDQGNEGACVAYSTVGALTTSYLNRTKPGNSREDLFDAKELYSHRENPRESGWFTNLALNWIMKNGIPFKNNRSKRLKIKNYYEYYKDGTVKKVILNSNGVPVYDSSFNETGGNGYNKMRKVLKSGEPLMVEYDVFPDFMAYAKVQGVYGGNVSSVVRAKSGHAVFLVGYVNPGIGGNAFPQWILQNSWGSNFGYGGLCRFAEGAANFDNVMYKIGDLEVIDSNVRPPVTPTSRPTPNVNPTPRPTPPPTNLGVNILFVNRLSQPASFYWVNNGEKFYKTLSKNTQYSQPTYANHTWVVKIGNKTVGTYRARSMSNQTVEVVGEQVEAGPLFNQQQAEQKCNNLARNQGKGWTGGWWTTVVGKMSVCEFARLKY